ncbi:MAG TPA: ACP phosphodiesterase [Salinivirgaceae bacterium]|nr:ACP phosphodiesterase [Salinivirgaceae bacterium]
MNYLAHLYLSRNHEELTVGNFIADFFKGTDFSRFPPQISDGIRFHRHIDQITDTNPNYRHVKNLFIPSHSRYSAIVADVVLDYVFAKHWETYNNGLTLQEFQTSVNKILLKHFAIMPIQAKVIIPFFVRNRWLTLYSDSSSMVQVLSGLKRFRRIPGDVDLAHSIYLNYQDQIFVSFQLIFEDVHNSLLKNFNEYSL